MCDVIGEKMPSGGTYIVMLDQHFLQACDNIRVNTAEGETSLFSLDVHELQIS